MNPPHTQSVVYDPVMSRKGLDLEGRWRDLHYVLGKENPSVSLK